MLGRMTFSNSIQNKPVQDMIQGMLNLANSEEEEEPSTKAKVESSSENKVIPLQIKKCSKEKFQIPTGFVRSSLFGVVGRGKRTAMERKEIASWKGWTIKYTGFQLDQMDEDILMALANMAQDTPDGIIRTSKRNLLRVCGKKGSGGRNMEIVKDSIIRMAACIIEVKYQQKWYSGHIINWIAGEDKNDDLVICMDMKMKWLWESSTWVNKEIRRSLGSFQLAKKMYDYICSQQATIYSPHQISLSKLMPLCGCNYKRERDFRKRLNDAMKEIESNSEIQWNIENNILKFWISK